MVRLPKKIMIILAAFLFAVLSLNRLPQFFVIFALASGCIYFIRRNAEKDMRPVMTVLFLSVFLIGILISLSLYGQTLETKYYGFSYRGDDYSYGDFGTIVGNLWRNHIFLSLEKLKYFNLIGDNIDVDPFQLYNAAVFYLFGACAGQILLIINSFLHAAVIVPLYFIFRSLGIKRNVAIFGFCLFLFWPSIFCWSLFNFKEPVFLFSLLAIISLLTVLRQRPKPVPIFLLAIFLCILCMTKKYLAVIIPIVFLDFIIFFKWRYKKPLILAALALLMALQLSTGFFRIDMESLGNLPYHIMSVRYASKLAATSYFNNIITTSYAATILYLPFGIVDTIVLPFFLKPAALYQIAVNVETIAWWCLLPFLTQGIWMSFRRFSEKTFVVSMTFVSWLVILAVTQGNMGTLIRQKSVIYYLGFIFVCLAIDRITDERPIHIV